MSTNKLELSDLVSFYPERSDINLQAIISSKKEFAELASLRNERIPEVQGELFNHQKFFGRFMQHYDRGLIIDKPGTGKTCKVVTAMEWFQLNRGVVKKFFVIAPNKAVLEDAKKQIICMCDTNDRYKLPSLIKNEFKGYQGQKVSATKGLSRYYRLFTHGQFARMLIKEYPDEHQIWENKILDYEKEGEGLEAEKVLKYGSPGAKIKESYPQYKSMGARGGSLTGRALENYILQIARNNPGEFPIGLTEKEIRKKASENLDRMVKDMSGAFYYLDEGHLLTIPDKNAKKDLLKQHDKQRHYNQYFRLFHSIKRSKIVITTATPMLNDPDDIKPLINLLREKDDLLPEKFDYSNASIEDVNYYFGGYISYVAPIDNKVNIEYRGEEVQHKIGLEGGGSYTNTVTVLPLAMSPFQNSWYNKIYEDERVEGLRPNALQASVFVFPDGSIGSRGLEKYAVRPKFEQLPGQAEAEFKKLKRTTVRWYRPKIELSRYMTRLFPDPEKYTPSIYDLSPKCAYIIDYANRDNNGVIYINIPYVDGGAIPFALCFEKMGYEIFTRRESVFQGTGDSDLRPYCPIRNEEESRSQRRIKDDFPPSSKGQRPRCAIFSSEKLFPSSVNEAALEIINSPENVNGNYVKVVIITPVGKVGISVNNVSKEFTVTSDWNESNNIQKEYRGIRATSHTTRIKQLQRELYDETLRETGRIMHPNELESVRVDLEIYRLAAIPNIGTERSVDLDLYLMAKEKEIRIQQFFRKLMIVAVDCALNKNRNQMSPPHKDYSAECNYQACQYTCYKEELGIDYSTYDIYYLGEALESIFSRLIPVFKKYGVVSYDKLFELPSLAGIPQKHIVIAVSELIGSKRGIKDRFGYTVYLNEKDGVIFLDREYPQIGLSDYSLYYYGKNLINVEYSGIDDTILEMESRIDDVIEQLKQYGPGNDIFYIELKSKSLNIQASILEYALEKWDNEQNGDFENAIINYYTGKWYRVHEPLKEINNEIAKEVAKGNRGRPRTRRIKKFRVNPLTQKVELIGEDDDQETVYFHILYIDKEEQTRHGKIARQIKGEGRYRLYKPSEGRGWREMDKYELIAYNIFIQNKRQVVEEEMKQNLIQSGHQTIYGRIDNGDLFIVDKTKENPFTLNGKTIFRGKKCTTWTKIELTPVMFELELMPPPEFLNYPIDYDAAYYMVMNNYNDMKMRIDPNEIQNWDPRKMDMYARWLQVASMTSHKYSKPKYYCPIIMQAMIDQGRIVEF